MGRMMGKRRAAGAVAAAVLMLGAGAALAEMRSETRSLGLTMIVEHPVLESVRAGVQDELKEQGFEDGRTLRIDYRNAQGNPSIAAQIARQFAGEPPDVVVAISTPSAQAMVNASNTVPIVFGSVTDPVGAKLVPGPGAGGRNVTGVADYPPVARQLSVIREILPDARRIGTVYSPGEANSVAQIEMLRAEAARGGFTIVEAPAMKSSDVQVGVRSLLGKVDLLYIPADNAVVAAIDAVLAVARQGRLPVFAPEEPSVEKGALAAVGHDYYRIGRETGALAARVLRGEAPGGIAWRIGSSPALTINAAVARSLGIVIPETVAKRAKLISPQ